MPVHHGVNQIIFKQNPLAPAADLHYLSTSIF